MPVVFVHGLGQDARIFDPASAFLHAHGVSAGCLHAIELSPSDGDNIGAAEQQIAPFIDGVLRDLNVVRAAARLTPTYKVRLVGHSMGALSARWYASVLHPERVAVLVSTSGANHGTDWECSDPYGAGHRQMCPAFARSPAQSALQFRLNGGPQADTDETPYGLGLDSPGVRHVPPDAARAILYVTLRTADDRYILPNESLLLDGAGSSGLRIDPSIARATSPGNFLLLEPSGHDELLSSPAALHWLLQVIRSQASGTP